MESTPEFNYQIEHYDYPVFGQIGTIKIYSSFVIRDDMETIINRSNFSCSLPTNEFIDDENSLHKQSLYYFLTYSGVDSQDADVLILKLVRLACEVTSSFEYCSHCALLMWLTLDHVAPSTEESFLEDSQVEEAIRASLDEYERNSEFRPASKLRVDALSRRIYKRKRKTSSIANQSTRYKRKRKTFCSSCDKCTICLDEFKTGREVATLLCGHEFDYKCIMEWLKDSHVCPLCRFVLPREGEIPQITKVF